MAPSVTGEKGGNGRMGEAQGRKLVRLFPTFPVVIAVAGEGDAANPITLAMAHVFSFDPPMVGLGINEGRHSHGLIKELPEFVVAFPRHTMVKETMAAGTLSGRDGWKWPKAGLTPMPSQVVRPPSVRECPVNLECQVVQEFETGDHTWFVGRIVAHNVEEGYSPDDAMTYWGGKFRKPGDVVHVRR